MADLVERVAEALFQNWIVRRHPERAGQTLSDLDSESRQWFLSDAEVAIKAVNRG